MIQISIFISISYFNFQTKEIEIDNNLRDLSQLSYEVTSFNY